MALNVIRAEFSDCTPLARSLIHSFFRSFIHFLDGAPALRRARSRFSVNDRLGSSLAAVTPPRRGPPAVIMASRDRVA